jgi:hypothetical protein
MQRKDLGLIAAVTVLSTGALWWGAGMKNVYQNFDGPYYLVVAKSWYDKNIIENNFSFPVPTEYYAAHFPLYPAMIRVINILGLNGFQAMVLGNLLATLGTGILWYRICRDKGWGNPLWQVLWWLFWWPRIWVVRSVGGPETLFTGLVLASLWMFDKRKYWLSGIFGALAAVTKSPGILLLAGYAGWWLWSGLKEKKWEWKIWPVGLILLGTLAVFGLFGLRTGDFLAYFHSGDNIHLQWLPFQVFDSNQPWVGDWWLEDVLWIFLIGALGVWRAFKKNRVFGWFGMVFLTSVLFVSHRDISRYSLPIVPIVLIGFADVLKRKEMKWVWGVMLIPLFLYSLNFILHNFVAIGNWGPFL